MLVHVIEYLILTRYENGPSTKVGRSLWSVSRFCYSLFIFCFFWFLSVCRHIIVLVLYSCFLLIENSKHKINVRPLPEIDWDSCYIIHRKVTLYCRTRKMKVYCKAKLTRAKILNLREGCFRTVDFPPHFIIWETWFITKSHPPG